MKRSAKHVPVKLVIGLFSQDLSSIARARKMLERRFGHIESESPLMNFSCTKYYEKEFGSDLKKIFLSFRRLVPLEGHYSIKLHTNALEKKLSKKGKRTVNIDPGYVSLPNLILYTTKNRSHRVYLDRGVYAEVELTYENRTFRHLDWTYPDYRSTDYISFFNSVRAGYYRDIQKTNCAN
tara:strand:- start:269 stop:808 length:540 start_codon:yes stop_codon:yes gene_type:complete